MKILAIGDFHGKFPEKLKKEASKADLILALGDYADADKIRKLIFKNWTFKPWYEVVGLNKARKLEKESFNSGLRLLRELSSLKKPVCIIWGNTDFYKDLTTSEPKSILPGNYDKHLRKLKNLRLIERKKISHLGTEIIGYGKYLDSIIFLKKGFDKDEKKRKKRLKRYLDSEKELNKVFQNFQPKEFIMVIHYPPLDVFDKVKYKGNPMDGKHVGWQPYNNIIKKYKPRLVLCGHMHEYQGKKMLGKSLIINPGAAYEGKAAIIDWPSLKVRFIR